MKQTLLPVTECDRSGKETNDEGSFVNIEKEPVENHLQKYNLEFLSFVQENYQSIFKGT